MCTYIHPKNITLFHRSRVKVPKRVLMVRTCLWLPHFTTRVNLYSSLYSLHIIVAHCIHLPWNSISCGGGAALWRNFTESTYLVRFCNETRFEIRSSDRNTVGTSEIRIKLSYHTILVERPLLCSRGTLDETKSWCFGCKVHNFIDILTFWFWRV